MMLGVDCVDYVRTLLEADSVCKLQKKYAVPCGQSGMADQAQGLLDWMQGLDLFPFQCHGYFLETVKF